MSVHDAVSDVVRETVGRRPGKILAVHLNYPSRCAERGRTPAEASYFLKPASSLTGSGPVVRPEGFELLQFEGEVAIVIATPARDVAPEDGWGHVGWVTAANDLGLQDLRYADKGSNVRSKGGDGFTAIGPALIAADDVDPARLRLRTLLDGEVVQDDTTEHLLFGFGHLIADLSRTMTLEPGDVILTGTPAGASVALPAQRIEVEVCSLDDPSVTSGVLVTEVVEGAAPGAWGSPPKADDEARADAWGARLAQPAPAPGETAGSTRSAASADADDPLPDLRDPALIERVLGVGVATLSVQLRRRGYDTVSIDGVRNLVPGRKFAGPARTLRYVAYRKDLFTAKSGGYTPQKQAIEAVDPGEVLVMEARGDSSAGTLGDILALRAQVRGCAGIITDGAVRDYALVRDSGLPVMSSGAHPAVLGRRHVPWALDETIVCGGATVQPGELVVADDDGAIVIPPALLLEVLADAEEQERQESFIVEKVRAGESVETLYPLGAAWQAEYAAWTAAQKPHTDTEGA